MAALAEIVQYANEYLRVDECGDWPNALNGLQVENSGRVDRMGAAVDASSRAVRAAAEQGIDLLLVHHGLFWPGVQAITGPVRRQLGLLFDCNIALYSAHLPLDVHPIAGNNAQLAAALGLSDLEPFLEAKGQLVGLRASFQIFPNELARKLEAATGFDVTLFASGPATTRTIGIITGGAGAEIHAVAREGVDTFITGEAPHWAAIAAEELGVNLLLGGHYATETFGVKALAAQLSQRFDLPWDFIDAPTGL
ncbi:MAG: Nif3-like dinuclear metal center hexameric protein [Chthoniobacterales bacterium]|nr:Nif3-like dinuclear metal center hexameric protein [Chthoniobacterales bacterium]